MNIGEVLDKIRVKEINGSIIKNAKGISYDSRRIEEGSMFFAVRGENTDGHAYIREAIKKGAQTIIYEDEIPAESVAGKDVLLVMVEDVRLALAYIAANYYGDPSQKLTLAGITGTNGKTTTSYITKSILEAYGKKVGLIGTIQYLVGDKAYNAWHTTPEAPEFQMYLRNMYEEGCDCVISEVSSHALAQKRVDAAEFDVAVFTNLTRDHMDYHGTMDNYFNAKSRLFKELLRRGGISVINIDDAYGMALSRELTEGLITYGFHEAAEVRAMSIEKSDSGLRFTVNYGTDYFAVDSNLRGYFNVYNILAAFSAGLALNVPVDNILAGISNLKSVRGRVEPVEMGQDFSVIVDYAHTDDALKNVVESVRKTCAGRIITIFGCGGNRDTGKRPLMGKVATTLSDFTIVTSDNPRFEDPMSIISQIEEGVSGPYVVEADRKKAIMKGIGMASAGDVVIIAGKGHETYQDIKNVKHPFNDREIAEKYISRRMKEKRYVPDGRAT
ncbi:MAG: UDP-N-acetylmuramoyl-L-alanyl-D-glutamate--2,6-diaminopimelate ligase [Nitrospirae bacterium]|nr:UDP-N-acetylmuramoyl-L-alanyl-D-glutamate--2,6-diaminopimelate ligase [Nitrospirota bacterium]